MDHSPSRDSHFLFRAAFLHESSGTPSISIILTGHNEEYCIGDAIRSVFGQDYEGPVEIILSDDGSSDGTFAVMQEMAAQYRGRTAWY